VEQIAARSPISDPNDFPTHDSQLAYWINAYNALVVKAVIQNWPTKSVRSGAGCRLLLAALEVRSLGLLGRIDMARQAAHSTQK
jgi:hypothetical protein